MRNYSALTTDLEWGRAAAEALARRQAYNSRRDLIKAEEALDWLVAHAEEPSARLRAFHERNAVQQARRALAEAQAQARLAGEPLSCLPVASVRADVMAGASLTPEPEVSNEALRFEAYRHLAD